MTNNKKPLGADAAAVARAGSIASDAAPARHTTEGPWLVETEYSTEPYYTPYIHVVKDEPATEKNALSRYVAEVTSDRYGDAHLIAAAPDLLDALKDCVEFQGCGDPDCCDAARAQVLARQRARAAIAKAEGR